MINRTHKRFDSSTTLWAETVLSGQVKIKTRIKNISMGGICMETSHNLSNDDIYNLKIGSGNIGKVTPSAKVVWSTLKKTVKENDNVIPLYDVGLKFIKMDDSAKFSLHKLLIKLIH